MSFEITEQMIARQPAEAQAIIRALLAEIAALRSELDELQRAVRGKTPQNSSLPPSTQHPHARPAPPRRKSKKRRGRPGGPPKARAPPLSDKGRRRGQTTQAARVPSWRRAAPRP